MWNESATGLGGGFLDDTQAEGTSKKGSQSNDKSIIPVWIKHITSTTGDLQIAGRTVNTLTFVGIVRRIEQDTTKMSFSIQDDTGTLTAIMWLEADKDPTENTCVQLDTYIRINGLIRNQGNQRHVLILRMYPVEDINEVTCHFMEVMHFIFNAIERKPKNEPNVSNTLMCDNTINGMSPDQVTILEIVRSANESECGIEKCDILRQMPKHIKPHIDDILDFLLCEGHIYTTSSEDFFKATS